ncbi:hypothetical protein CU098_002309, partial [Rhizopus stolonifer]
YYYVQFQTKEGIDYKTVFALYLYAMSLISYSIIMIKTPSPVPSWSKSHSMSLCNEKGGPLYCNRCNIIKPERTHHCSECDQCAPKMDQINGCVDQGNYKQFFLFVFYVAAYALWVEFNTLPILLNMVKDRIPGGRFTWSFCFKVYKTYLSSIYYFWRNIVMMVWYRTWIPLLSGVEGLGLDDISPHWYSVCALGCVFGLTVSGFALAHFCFIIKNKTSIEFAANRPIFVRVDFDQTGENYRVVCIKEKKDFKNMYDVGMYQNWCSVMGSKPLLWLVPFNSASLTNESSFAYNPAFTAHVLKLAN